MILIFYMVITGLGIAQTHFTTPIGNPYLPMTIFIIGAKTQDGLNITAGTEIGVFGKSDLNRCVGAAVLTGAVIPSNPVQIIASKNDSENGGFTDGDSIVFKLWDSSIQQEHIVKSGDIKFYEPETGVPAHPVTFIGLGTAAVDIQLSTFIDVKMERTDVEPSIFHLEQNYPNPFNPSTRINYTLPVADQIRLDIFNMKGDLVVKLFEGPQRAGFHKMEWNGTDSSGLRVSSGMYLCRLASPETVEIKKMILSK